MYFTLSAELHFNFELVYIIAVCAYLKQCSICYCWDNFNLPSYSYSLVPNRETQTHKCIPFNRVNIHIIHRGIFNHKKTTIKLSRATIIAIHSLYLVEPRGNHQKPKTGRSINQQIAYCPFGRPAGPFTGNRCFLCAFGEIFAVVESGMRSQCLCSGRIYIVCLYV